MIKSLVTNLESNYIIKADDASFRIEPIEPTDRDIESSVYVANVNRFRQGAESFEHVFRELDTVEGTRRPTGPRQVVIRRKRSVHEHEEI